MCAPACSLSPVPILAPCSISPPLRSRFRCSFLFSSCCFEDLQHHQAPSPLALGSGYDSMPSIWALWQDVPLYRSQRGDHRPVHWSSLPHLPHNLDEGGDDDLVLELGGSQRARCSPRGSASSSTAPVDTSDFPLVQTKIVDFFHIQKPLASYLEDANTGMEGRRRRKHSLCLYKKKRKLLPHVPSKDPARRLLQMASLATALSSTKVEFSDELTYPRGLAPESANRAANERGGMQVIGKEDLATLNLCKLMCARGEWLPLMVTHDPREGFVVEADNHIKDLTLIAEYTGDVDYMRNRLNDDSDNLMVLLFPHDASKELVICPDKRGNIARFISGINNHTLEGRKKQNLRCVRYDINGQSRVLLIAIRDIAKGERLYYDYNAYHKEYPTQHFV